MTGTVTIYARAQAERVAEKRRIGLVGKSEELLIEIFDRGREHAVTEPWGLLSASQEFYDGIAAAKILSERYGEEYVLGLEGRRKPVTLKEKVVYVLFDHLPKV